MANTVQLKNRGLGSVISSLSLCLIADLGQDDQRNHTIGTKLFRVGLCDVMDGPLWFQNIDTTEDYADRGSNALEVIGQLETR
jgi:hypothetical protein